MIEWKLLDLNNLPEDGDYLVTDETCVDVAHIQSFEWGDGLEPELFLPDRSGIDGKNTITHYAVINLPATGVNLATTYQLLLDPGKPGFYKTKYLNEAENDEQAIEQAKAYAEEKGWQIARLSREIKGTLDLILFDHSRRS